jgi:hypothetical protein
MNKFKMDYPLLFLVLICIIYLVYFGLNYKVAYRRELIAIYLVMLFLTIWRFIYAVSPINDNKLSHIDAMSYINTGEGKNRFQI